MFDYPLLEVLSAIEKERSFERAAQILGVSKSYISQRLRLLEERMGGSVVCRETVNTTHFGKTLCRHYEHIGLLEHEFLTKNAHHYETDQPDPITIKIAIDNDSLASWFKSILNEISPTNNRYFLDVITCDAASTREDMNVGRVHCALSTSQIPLPGFECHHLGSHCFRATASPEYHQRYFSSGITMQSLAKAPAMRGTESDILIEQWTSDLFGRSLNLPASVVPSAHGVLNACLNGDVWAMNSSILVDPHLGDGTLLELMPEVKVDHQLYWHINTFLSRTLSDLTGAITDAGNHLGSNNATAVSRVERQLSPAMS